jgi:SAM-dependent methyltransferase
MARQFVQFYDDIYADKDYAKDIRDFQALSELERIERPRILEIGAGTGNQTVRLAGLVRELVSVEIDPDFAEMLATKVEAAALGNVAIATCPLDQVRAGDFDAAAAFFHVLNYVGDLGAFAAALASRLRPGAWFVADLWNRDAVYRDPPRAETRIKTARRGPVTQTIEPTVDRARHRVRLHYDIAVDLGGETVRFTEDLDLFVWSRSEVERAFADAGFDSMSFWDYRSYPAAARDDSWGLWLRARRRS